MKKIEDIANQEVEMYKIAEIANKGGRELGRKLWAVMADYLEANKKEKCIDLIAFSSLCVALTILAGNCKDRLTYAAHLAKDGSDDDADKLFAIYDMVNSGLQSLGKNLEICKKELLVEELLNESGTRSYLATKGQIDLRD